MKKKFSIIAISLTLLSGSLVVGQEAGKGKGAPGGDRPSPGERFKELDKNGDGIFSKDEVPERAWQYLSRMDKNEDDQVTREEMMAAAKDRGQKGKGKSEPGEMFKRADKNKDGKLSKDEVPAQLWERISKLDKDGDGAIAQSELPKRGETGGKGGPQAGKGGSGGMFAFYDKNKDGKVEKSEVPEEAWAKLSRVDKNADGLISESELAGAMKDRAPGGNDEKANTKKRPSLEE